MESTQEILERVVQQVVQHLQHETTQQGKTCQESVQVPVGVSNRHVHLSRSDMDALFGPGSELVRMKAMKQPGQYAAEETIIVKGPKGSFNKVRVLGPLRKETQIEISVSDGFSLGVNAPLRQSGDLKGSPGIELIGPYGSVKKETGLIVAQRHIHMTPETAEQYGFSDGDDVSIYAPGNRAMIMKKILLRVTTASANEMHIDIDEANAALLKNDDMVMVSKG